MARKSNDQILADLRTESDGLLSRPIGLWTLDKLGILLLYFRAFTRASKKAQGGYYVDGLAGSGMCRVKETGSHVWGSALIALRTAPPFLKCILLEQGARNCQALAARVDSYGKRVRVYQGDVNLRLPDIINRDVPKNAPCFCLLDPEGTELKWKTIRQVARLPGRRRKPELLILFPLQMGLLRLMTVVSPMSRHHRQLVDDAFGTSAWSDIHRARIRGAISPQDAKARYVELYCANLRGLGYKVPEPRIVKARARAGAPSQERYYLVFATDHPAGEEIMSDVFRRWYALDPEQRPLFELA